jgi:hypothetical protein
MIAKALGRDGPFGGGRPFRIPSSVIPQPCNPDNLKLHQGHFFQNVDTNPLCTMLPRLLNIFSRFTEHALHLPFRAETVATIRILQTIGQIRILQTVDMIRILQTVDMIRVLQTVDMIRILQTVDMIRILQTVGPNPHHSGDSGPR